MAESAALAFKAYEIEELADIYFYRPAGWVVAVAARSLRITPNALSILSGVVGVAGGLLVYPASWGVTAFVVLVLHGAIDSADGQLARMTGRVTPLGRVLDGVAGYAMHAAVYLGLAAGMASRGEMRFAFGWALAAGLCTVVHAQAYDYHRTTYADIVLRGQVGRSSRERRPPAILRAYEAAERAAGGWHPEVEHAIQARAFEGRVRDADRDAYRSTFYRLVRGWNLMGDNTRVYAVGVLAWFHRLDLFFLFVLIPMNIAFVVLWLSQARADRRVLEGRVIGWPGR